MKGDFSRDTFDRKKHYSSVLMQQGRVQVDADWNEQQAINRHRMETETLDVVGPSGAPAINPGFKITVANGEKLSIGAGRYYVDGILCENELDIDYRDQPDLPDPPDLNKLLTESGAEMAIVYLDVWQRHITALDDPYISEKALGGPDTSTRVKTVWQVKLFPVKKKRLTPAPVRRVINNKISIFEKMVRSEGVEATAKANEVVGVLNQYMVIPEIDLLEMIKGDESSFSKEIKSKFINAGATERIKENLLGLLNDLQKLIPKETAEMSCSDMMSEWESFCSFDFGAMNARTRPESEKKSPCQLPPTAGYQRLENQLYRVEVHTGGKIGEATFKWSRDNAAIASKITEISGDTSLKINNLELDDAGRYSPGKWVEIIDDESELKGLPGQLVQIERITETGEITLVQSLSNVDLNSAKLRCWDSAGEIKIDVSNKNDGWINLEDGGIEVKFSKGNFRTGDYWLIPARTITGGIEWPQYESGSDPIPQPPLGIEHHFCRLALIRLEKDKIAEVTDCRKIFTPLVGPPAIHILKTNWKNDVVGSGDVLKQLVIYLDAQPHEASVKNSLIVTAEIPMGFNFKDAENTPDLICIIDGNAKVEGSRIVWTLTPLGGSALDQIKTGRAGVETRANKPHPIRIRVRVLLKGHTIWSEQNGKRLYLDGQAFGYPDKERTALEFPTGNGARASDFESWFFLTPS